MTWDPNIEITTCEPNDAESVDAELELLLKDLESVLPPELESEPREPREQEHDR